MKTISLFGIAVLFAFVCLWPTGTAIAAAGDTLWVPITYYDFHSDNNHHDLTNVYDGTVSESSCPEFGVLLGSIGAGRNGDCGTPPCPIFATCTDSTKFPDVVTGMVATMLDADNKPVRGIKNHFSRGIDKWFRPWTPGDFIRPIYRRQCLYYNNVWDNAWDGDIAVAYDTSFKNIVFKDSLPFVDAITVSTAYESFTEPAGNRIYTYHNPLWFPLDNKGFGHEPCMTGAWAGGNCLAAGHPEYNHNFGFTGEISVKFQYKASANQMFRFNGDDDAWVFVNKKLAVDLGGIHRPFKDSLILNNISVSHGLVDGNQYTLNFFIAERKPDGSYCTIMTNIPERVSRRLR